MALLLERGASLKYLTDDNKSVVDLACDAENWDLFELFKNAADEQYPHVLPKNRKLDHRRDFFPSGFFFKLRSPFGDHDYKNLRLVSAKAAEDIIEDIVLGTRKLKIAGGLGEMVPYPEENIHLICESAALSASILVPRILMIFESTLPRSHSCCVHAPREGGEYRARVGFCWVLVKSMLKISSLRGDSPLLRYPVASPSKANCGRESAEGWAHQIGHWKPEEGALLCLELQMAGSRGENHNRITCGVL